MNKRNKFMLSLRLSIDFDHDSVDSVESMS